MGVYKEMGKNWQTYCLMSAITYIEEMSKPNPCTQIKKYKNKEYICTCFRTIRLKMKNKEFPKMLLKTTRKWEKEKKTKFIGKTYKNLKIERFDGQFKFHLSPLWINYILSECGRIPNKYSFESAVNRVNNLVQYKRLPVNESKKLFNILFENKKLAAGAFIISMDLECRGIQAGRPSLCMSEKFKDFLEFMLKIAKKWNWTNNQDLSPVNMNYNRALGISASAQFEFRIKSKSLKEIYELAGPLCDQNKNENILFHINRSNNYINKGHRLRENKTMDKIIKALKKGENTTTKLQFYAGVGQDVILDHLHKLELNGRVIKERNGKRYIWSIKNAS